MYCTGFGKTMKIFIISLSNKTKQNKTKQIHERLERQNFHELSTQIHTAPIIIPHKIIDFKIKSNEKAHSPFSFTLTFCDCNGALKSV